MLLGVSGCGGPKRPADADAVFYPPPPQQPRIQFLTRIFSSSDVEKRSGFNKFVVGETPEVRLGKPYGVAMHDGIIYVCDTGLNAVMTIDLLKGAIEPLRSRGAGRLRKPISLVVDEAGFKYIADVDRGQIVVLGPDNRFRRTYGEPGTIRPTAVAVGKTEVFVNDLNEHRIVVFDRKSGAVVRSFGERGRGEGQFDNPTHLALDVEGNLYVTEAINCRVQKLTPAGEHLRNFGQPGDAIGDFARPKGVAVSRDGHVYVIDAAFENVQIFDQSGDVLLFFGGSGTEPGNMWLPAGLAIDYDSVDLFADRVARGQKIEYLILVTSQFGPPHVDIYGFLGAH